MTDAMKPVILERASSCTLCDEKDHARAPAAKLPAPSPAAAPAEDFSGPVVHGAAGEWATGRVLGEGAFAAVRLARGKSGTAVAKTTPTSNPRNLLFALREARVLAHLPPHRSIPPLLDVARSGDAVHAVMARAPGEELFSYVNNQPGGLLPEAEARVIVAELLEALRHSHAHGVLHRDVKLDNVFWDASTGTLSLIDFGLATFFDDRTLLDESVGCINYAGPGLLRLVNQRRPYSPRGGHPDLHAVGVLAHGLLTGYFPFRHEDPLELQAEIAAGLPAPVEGASGAANAFLAAVLDPRNEGRITAESLLAHPWLADLAVERAPMRSGVTIPKLPSSAFDARRAAKAVDADLARILPAYLASLDAVADAESSGDESDATLRVERAGSDVSMASVETAAAALVPAQEPEPAPVHAHEDKPRKTKRFDPAKWFGKVRRQRVAAA